MIVQTIEISLSKGRAPELLAHLGESNRQIEMIPDVTLPETAGAEINIVKPDGTFVIDAAEITDGHIIVTLPDQACTVKGLSHYILKITDTGTVIYSAYGNVFVDDHLITDDLIESIAEANGYEFPDDFLTDDNLEANPSGSATDTLYRLKIFDTVYGVGGGGGADVEANPTGTPTDTLDALRVDDGIYEVEKPIPIEANPSGSATDTLNTLMINNSIYDVSGVHYSTAEQVVGTWIDGSTVYEKTFQIASLPQADNVITHGIANLGKVLKYWGNAHCTAFGEAPIPLVSSSLAQYIIHVYSFTSTVFHLERGTAYTGNNALSNITITMQYTKSS